MALAGKAAVVGTVCTFAALTTGMLHWATKGYVRKLLLRKEDADGLKDDTLPDAGDVEVTVETLRLIGTTTTSRFLASDMDRAADGIGFKTFSAGGK
jgi:hypothetical protein